MSIEKIDGKRWYEVNKVIYITVTLDKPTNGEEWISRTEKSRNQVVDHAKSVLRSKGFTSSAVGRYKIAILKASLFEDGDRVSNKICSEARKKKLVKLNADIIALIREQVSDYEIQDMGLKCIVGMHKPIKDSDDCPRLLAANRSNGGRRLDVYSGFPDDTWDRGFGFAFLVPQVS